MRRLIAAVVAAMAVGVAAAPASADTFGNQPPGPPLTSGHGNTSSGPLVVHCKAVDEGLKSVVALNKNGAFGGGTGSCFQ
jgi:hypothetical protein